MKSVTTVTDPEGKVIGTRALTDREVAQVFVASGQGNPDAQMMVKVWWGQSLGINAAQAALGIYVMEGNRIALSANLMAAQVRKHAQYDYEVIELSNERVEIAFFYQREAGAEFREIGRSIFDLEDAETAGLLGGRNAHSYTKYPRNMLFARAMSNGCRWFCPDIFGGPAFYNPEELGAVVDASAEDGEFQIIDLAPPAEPDHYEPSQDVIFDGDGFPHRPAECPKHGSEAWQFQADWTPATFYCNVKGEPNATGFNAKGYCRERARPLTKVERERMLDSASEYNVDADDPFPDWWDDWTTRRGVALEAGVTLADFGEAIGLPRPASDQEIVEAIEAKAKDLGSADAAIDRLLATAADLMEAREGSPV